MAPINNYKLWWDVMLQVKNIFKQINKHAALKFPLGLIIWRLKRKEYHQTVTGFNAIARFKN